MPAVSISAGVLATEVRAETRHVEGAMFEDSLLESTGRIRTKSRWTALGSLVLQSALLAVLLVLPEIYPDALPRQSLSRLLIAPPPPASAPVQQPVGPRSNTPAVNAVSLQDVIAAPRQFPEHALLGVRDAPPPSYGAPNLDSGSRTGIPGGLDDLLSRNVPGPAVRPPPRLGPVHVSSGVAAGQLLSPIQVTYPAIAKQLRIEGTVIVAATISRQGVIENLRVVSGPELLRSAAVDAIRVARYRPFLLDDEAVEVETTINVVFSLGR
jgi:periplasmic protein TonB